MTFMHALPAIVFKMDYLVNCKRAMEVVREERLRHTAAVWEETCQEAHCPVQRHPGRAGGGCSC